MQKIKWRTRGKMTAKQSKKKTNTKSNSKPENSKLPLLTVTPFHFQMCNPLGSYFLVFCFSFFHLFYFFAFPLLLCFCLFASIRNQQNIWKLFQFFNIFPLMKCMSDAVVLLLPCCFEAEKDLNVLIPW